MEIDSANRPGYMSEALGAMHGYSGRPFAGQVILTLVSRVLTPTGDPSLLSAFSKYRGILNPIRRNPDTATTESQKVADIATAEAETETAGNCFGLRIAAGAIPLLLRDRVPHWENSAVGDRNIDPEGTIVLFAVIGEMMGKSLPRTDTTELTESVQRRTSAITELLSATDTGDSHPMVDETPGYLNKEQPEVLRRVFFKFLEMSGDSAITDLAIASAIVYSLLENLPREAEYNSYGDTEFALALLETDKHLKLLTAEIMFPLLSYIGFHTEIAEQLAEAYYKRYYGGLSDSANKMLKPAISPQVETAIRGRTISGKPPYEQINYILNHQVGPYVDKVLDELFPELIGFRGRAKALAQTTLKAMGLTSASRTPRRVPSFGEALRLLKSFLEYTGEDSLPVSTQGPAKTQLHSNETEFPELRWLEQVNLDNLDEIARKRLEGIHIALRGLLSQGRYPVYNPVVENQARSQGNGGRTNWEAILDKYITDYAGLMYTIPHTTLQGLMRSPHSLREFLTEIYLNSDGRFVPVYVNSEFVGRKQTPYSPPFLNMKVFDLKYMIFFELRIWSDELLAYEATTHREYKRRASSQGEFRRNPIEFFADPVVQFGTLVAAGYTPLEAKEIIDEIASSALAIANEKTATGFSATIKQIIVRYLQLASNGEHAPVVYRPRKVEKMLEGMGELQALEDTIDPDLIHAVGERYFKFLRSTGVEQPTLNEDLLDSIIHGTITQYHAQKLLHDRIASAGEDIEVLKLDRSLGQLNMTKEARNLVVQQWKDLPAEQKPPPAMLTEVLYAMLDKSETKTTDTGEWSQVWGSEKVGPILPQVMEISSQLDRQEKNGFQITELTLDLIKSGANPEHILKILYQCQIIFDETKPNNRNSPRLTSKFRRKFGTVEYLIRHGQPHNAIRTLADIISFL